ncbi:MAG: 2-C-methyl-D-erythritol 4-phosphate cytidylyltransferase [Nitrospirae bacterium]|nr:2-C-methyl-D-erythritol 4-phosphate cytidylyltransferase [Nitrospirota bacterium]
MHATAIIVAAGRGKRMGHTLPKQYIRLEGVPILVHTLKVFEISPEIRNILLVVPPGDEEFCLREVIERYDVHKVLKVVIGGEKRQDSVHHALQELEEETDIIAVHDGVRPFISPEMIRTAVKTVDRFDGAIFAVPVRDTLKKADASGLVSETPDRSLFWYAQTPQAFKRGVLVEAYQKAAVDRFQSTDDSALVERLGYRVKILEGSPENIKITSREDLLSAEFILRGRHRASS